MLRPRPLTLLCYGAMMSLAIGVNLLPVFLTSLSLTFGGQDGLSQEQLGRLGAISFIGLVLGILIAGPASDRWGAKGFAIGGNGIMVLSLVGMSLAPDYGILGLAVFWLGFDAGILDMILSPVVAVLNPDRRSAAMNWLHSFYCVGAVVTILASTVALQIGVGWRHACLLLLPLPFGLSAAFALLRFAAGVADSETAGRTPLRHLLRGRWFWGAFSCHLSRRRHRTGNGSVATGLCRNYLGISAVGWWNGFAVVLGSHGSRADGRRSNRRKG